MVVAGEEAFLLMPPEVVCSGGFQHVYSSPAGRYAVVMQAKENTPSPVALAQGKRSDDFPKGGEIKLLLWDSRKAQTRTVWRGLVTDTSGTGPIDFKWLGKTNKAIIPFTTTQPDPTGKPEPKRTIRFYIFNAVTGSLAPVNLAPLPTPFLDVQVSPFAPVAVANTTAWDAAERSPNDEFGNPTYPSRLTIIRENGDSVSVSLLPGGIFLFPIWSSDPNLMYIHEVRRTGTDAQGKAVRENSYFSLNLKTAAYTKLPEKPKDYQGGTKAEEASAQAAQDAMPIDLQSTRMELSQTAAPGISPKAMTPQADTKVTPAPQTDAKPMPKTDKSRKPPTKSLALLYLQSKVPSTNSTDESRILVAAEAEAVALLPDASAAFYTVRGNLFAAPIVRIDAKTMLAMRQKATQEQVMVNAKQIGLGLLMYSQDYDENLPNDPGAIKDTVFPYIKNADVFNGFQYTYTGAPSVGKIDSPASTKLGYVQGPGGRAVIYADGHVKWEPE